MKLHRPRLTLLCWAILAATYCPDCRAEWQTQGTLLRPVTEWWGQEPVAIVPDGQGGAIVFIVRSSDLDSLFAQRITTHGQIAPGWPTGGVFVPASDHMIYSGHGQVTAIADGQSGAIVAWEEPEDASYSSFQAQRVDSSGSLAWGTGPVEFFSHLFAGHLDLVSDGAGGAYLVTTVLNGADSLYIQRVTADGALVPGWSRDGARFGDGVGCLVGAADGSGGLIVASLSAPPGVPRHVRAVRVNSSHEIVAGWPVDLCTACGNLWSPFAVPDGESGAIVAWTDDEDDSDLYAQRVRADGTIAWAPNGVVVDSVHTCDLSNGSCWVLSMVSDDAHGAILARIDYRDPDRSNIRAQRVDSTGTVAPQHWPADGLELATWPLDGRGWPAMTADGAGGAIVTWVSVSPSWYANYYLYAQRVTAAGDIPQGWWRQDGNRLCTIEQVGWPPVIATDDSGGAIVAWTRTDGRYPGTYGVYAQRITGDGISVDVPEDNTNRGPTLRLLQPRPNPAHRGATIALELPVAVRATCEVLDVVGRRVRTLASDRTLPAGTQYLSWDGRDDRGAEVVSGVYFLRLEAAGIVQTQKMVLAR